jgi:hypothetical protein
LTYSVTAVTPRRPIQIAAKYRIQPFLAASVWI